MSCHRATNIEVIKEIIVISINFHNFHATSCKVCNTDEELVLVKCVAGISQSSTLEFIFPAYSFSKSALTPIQQLSTLSIYHLSIYISIYLFTYIYFYLYIHLSIFLSIYLSFFLSIYLYIYLSIYPSIYSTYLLYLSAFLSVYLHISPSIYLSIHLSYLSIFLSIYYSHL